MAQGLPDIGEWRANQLRLTAFPTESFDASGWWKQLTGDDPEETTLKKGEQIYEGRIDATVLQLVTRPDVVNWIQRSSEEIANPEGEDLPSVGVLPDSVEAFAGRMKQWLPLSPKLKRIAFGVLLQMPVESHVEGYRLLNRYLQSVELREDAADFQYRINLSRPSGTRIEGLTINRLMNWAVLRWGVRSIQFGHEGINLGLEAKEGFACQLQLDINTSQHYAKDLPESQVEEIWTELIDLALEIAAEGEKP